MLRRRFRKWAKWACSLAAGVALSTLVATRWRAIGWVSPSRTWALGADNEAITAQWKDGPFQGERSPSGFYAARSHFEGHGLFWWPALRSARGLVIVFVPYWIPLLPVAPALFLWHAEYLALRRARPPRCRKCGYARAGLAADTKCPECGAVPAVPAPAKR